MNLPYVPPPAEGPQREIKLIGLLAPFRWLVLGLGDLKNSKRIALFYGICFWGMAQTVSAIFNHMPEYTLSFVSGCLLLGPFLTMGLYEVSRRREIGKNPDLLISLTCWDPHLRSMGLLVLVLIVLELLWGRASLIVFAVFFNTGMPSSASVMQAVFNPLNWEFVAVYLVVGGFFAALVFSTMVVSLPMILDKGTDAITAAITSIQVVYENTATMLLWGILITSLVLIALLPWGLGLLLIGPWLGHASWHAYRGTVLWIE